MDASSSLQKEDINIQIRDNLRKRAIKLWLQPYYDEQTGPCYDNLKALAQEFSGTLNITAEDSFEAVLYLQTHSLENLKQNKRFKETGLATLKIKVLHQNSPPRILTKELLLSLRVVDLKDLIAQEVNVNRDRLKIICSGKVLADSDNLSSQGVKNGQQILAISFAESSTKIQEFETSLKELEAIKSDSRLLALDDNYMQLEDQFGNAVKIPGEQKKALMVALALHEKGRAALKREDYSKALIVFLEADEEFSRCNLELLDTVDNYALLNLDIAWCYLNLHSVSHLPEAYERLKKCEERFHKCYGATLERLIEVKGLAGNEAPLFMRLHLLQGIVLYHQNKREKALESFRKAQQELLVLKVDERSVLMLAELGYSVAEARLGLRATQGDVNRAANYINENREKRSEGRKKALSEEILQKKRVKLGKCDDGVQYVNPSFVNMLVNMGYNKEASRVALQKCNNIISDSIQYIQENPQPGPSQSKSQECLSLINDLVPEFEAAGFSPDMAKLALHKHSCDIVKAAEDLLAHGGVVEGDVSVLIKLEESYNKTKELNKEKEKEKAKAFRRLAEDISMVDDDHLDLSLAQEEVFLYQYLSLLESK